MRTYRCIKSVIQPAGRNKTPTEYFTRGSLYPEQNPYEAQACGSSVVLEDNFEGSHEVTRQFINEHFEEILVPEVDPETSRFSRGCAYAIAFLLTAAAIAFIVIKYRS